MCMSVCVFGCQGGDKYAEIKEKNRKLMAAVIAKESSGGGAAGKTPSRKTKAAASKKVRIYAIERERFDGGLLLTCK